MTKIDEHNDNRNPDNKLDRLIGLGEPLPRMPENLKARIRSRLAEVGQKSDKKSFFIRRWAIVSPLSAAAVLALLLIIFWPGGTPGTISWADVQKKLEQVHTMTAKMCNEITTTDGERTEQHSKIYIKDPGLSRIEMIDPGVATKHFIPGPKSTTITKSSKSVPGLTEELLLYPDSHRGVWFTWIGSTGEPLVVDLLGASPQKDNNYVLGLWDQIKRITVGKPKIFCKRVINGKPAVVFGFEVPVPYETSARQESIKARGKIWVGLDDGVPLLIEVEYKVGKEKGRIEWSDIQWNVPLEESLFEFTVPAGWGLSRKRDHSIEYTGFGFGLTHKSVEYSGFGFSPSVTMEICPEGQEPLATAGDVSGLVKTERTTYPFPKNTSRIGLITIELKPEATKRLREYAETHPDKIIVVNFNGQIRVAAKLDAAHPTQLSFDITLIRITTINLEKNYITPDIERNKP